MVSFCAILWKHSWKQWGEERKGGLLHDLSRNYRVSSSSSAVQLLHFMNFCKFNNFVIYGFLPCMLVGFFGPGIGTFLTTFMLRHKKNLHFLVGILPGFPFFLLKMRQWDFEKRRENFSLDHKVFHTNFGTSLRTDNGIMVMTQLKRGESLLRVSLVLLWGIITYESPCLPLITLGNVFCSYAIRILGNTRMQRLW